MCSNNGDQTNWHNRNDQTSCMRLQVYVCIILINPLAHTYIGLSAESERLRTPPRVLWTLAARAVPPILPNAPFLSPTTDYVHPFQRALYPRYWGEGKGVWSREEGLPLGGVYTAERALRTTLTPHQEETVRHIEFCCCMALQYTFTRSVTMIQWI